MTCPEVGRPTGRLLKRLAPDGSFAGHASVFAVTDAQGDRVQPGAFAASLADWRRRGQMPPLLWQHDLAQPIGRIDRLEEDATGLLVEGRLSLETARGREAVALLRLGALDGLSIGYATVSATVAADGARLLKTVELHEISLVTLPANEAARIAWVKSAAGDLPAVSAIVSNLRRAAAALRP